MECLQNENVSNTNINNMRELHNGMSSNTNMKLHNVSNTNINNMRELHNGMSSSNTNMKMSQTQT